MKGEIINGKFMGTYHFYFIHLRRQLLIGRHMVVQKQKRRKNKNKHAGLFRNREDIPMNNHSENFEKVKEQLHKQGYKEKDVTIPSGKAMTLGILYALPYVLVFGLLYRFFLIKKAALLEVSGLSFYIIFITIVAISVIIHELLHGAGWAIASGKGWNAVHFNINAMMPSCACKVALKKKAYLFGVLTPFAVLGFGSVFFIFIYPGTISFLTMVVNFISAGADLIIAFNILKEKNTLIIDHPKKAGYIAFYK